MSTPDVPPFGGNPPGIVTRTVVLSSTPITVVTQPAEGDMHEVHIGTSVISLGVICPTADVADRLSKAFADVAVLLRRGGLHVVDPEPSVYHYRSPR